MREGGGVLAGRKKKKQPFLIEALRGRTKQSVAKKVFYRCTKEKKQGHTPPRRRIKERAEKKPTPSRKKTTFAGVETGAGSQRFKARGS